MEASSSRSPAGWRLPPAGSRPSPIRADPAPAVVTEPLAGTADGPQGGGDRLSVGEIYERSAPGVVFIEAEGPTPEASPFGPFGLPEDNTASGSGFVIDDEGRIMTNAHVVAGAEQVTVKVGEDDEPVEAELIGQDLSTDVALIQVDPDEIELHELPLGDSDTAEVGAPVVAIGNPFGLDRTVTTGIVSALQRQIRAPDGFAINDVIQTDAAINPGNSGGPLFDSNGRVIGINSQIATAGGGGSVGIGFAVPINTAREVAGELQDEGEVSRAYLGVTGADLTEEIADVVNLDLSSGALIQQIVADSPADDAGLRDGSAGIQINDDVICVGGDVIVEANGEQIKTMEEVVGIVSGLEPGDELRLIVIRDGEEEQIDVELGARPEQAQSADPSVSSQQCA